MVLREGNSYQDKKRQPERMVAVDRFPLKLNEVGRKRYSINFTQYGVSETFSDGTYLQETIERLRDGKIDFSDLPRILIYLDSDGNWRSLDNRRLECFISAGVEYVPVYVITDEEAQELLRNSAGSTREKSTPERRPVVRMSTSRRSVPCRTRSGGTSSSCALWTRRPGLSRER